MTREEAFLFLRSHQPMPADAELSRKLLEQYDECRQYFLRNPDPEAVPLIINSFGDGSGFGVYQLVEDVLRPLPPAAVVPSLVAGLQSEHRGVRYWSAQIASQFPANELIRPLEKCLESQDSDLRFASAAALGQMGDPKAIAILKAAANREAVPDIREFMEEIVEGGS